MPTKTQRKKQEAQRRKRKLQRERTSVTSTVNRQFSRRVERQKPFAWTGEQIEDVAVFDDQVLTELSPELQSEAKLIRSSLLDAGDSFFDLALQRLTEIPRKSPYAQWRLFIRGYVHWLRDEHEEASEVWARMEDHRRPKRIAIALVASARKELAALSVPYKDPISTEGFPENPKPYHRLLAGLDSQTLSNARFLRRITIERPAIQIAETELGTHAANSEFLKKPRIYWLSEFSKNFRRAEPELVAELEKTILRKAYFQEDFQVFELAAKTFRGPIHDRNNFLLSYFYINSFDDNEFYGNEFDEGITKRGDTILKAYLDRELPSNNELPPSVASAIASYVCLIAARHHGDELNSPMNRFLQTVGEEVIPRVCYWFKSSISRYPGNAEACNEFQQFLESQLKVKKGSKEDSKSLKDDLEWAMKSWTKAAPDDRTPRLWLVDHLIVEENLEEAKEHVDWLKNARIEDPSVKALDWKWELLGAFRFARRKTSLDKSREALDNASEAWPTWLSKEWLPYFYAALSLRQGNTSEFEKLHVAAAEQAGVQPNSVSDASMMLGAAQHLRVPAAALKPLRVPIENALGSFQNVDTDDLINAGSFYWDLNRTKLFYSAYGKHGKKFMQELYRRLELRIEDSAKRMITPKGQATFLLFADHYFFGRPYAYRLPTWANSKSLYQLPRFVAGRISARCGAVIGVEDPAPIQADNEALKGFAETEPDPYYRFWFKDLTEQIEKRLNETDFFSFFGRDMSRFNAGGKKNEPCDCYDCRMERGEI